MSRWKSTDEELRNWFDTFNQKYFGNGLPKETSVVWKKPYVEGHGAEFIPLRRTDGRWHLLVLLNPVLMKIGAENYAMQNLLHEMCHLSLWARGKRRQQYSGHGYLFQKEMKRLVNLGAFQHIW